MRTVLGLAMAAVVALVLSLLTGSILAAVLVVMLALAGIVLLLRDWRADSAVSQATAPDPEEPAAAEHLTADELSPDIAGPDQL